MGKRILIADDISSNRNLLKIYLTDIGHIVDDVNNGKEVLKLLEKKKFDLIILDLNMPEMYGLDVIETIRSNKGEYQNICIFVLSAFVSSDTRLKCFQLGVNEIMIKPVDLDDLNKIIKKWFPKAIKN